MLSHLMSHGQLFGSLSLGDAGLLLFFFDCLAFTLLVTYWDALGGRAKLQPAAIKVESRNRAEREEDAARRR